MDENDAAETDIIPALLERLTLLAHIIHDSSNDVRHFCEFEECASNTCAGNREMIAKARAALGDKNVA